jgi:tight adherence protein B
VSIFLLPFIAGSVASFLILLFVLRPQATSKVTSRRLGNIRKSTRSGESSTNEASLEKEDPWGYMESIETLLERYGPGRTIKRVLLHSNTNLSLSGFLMASTGLALVCASVGFLLSHITLVGIASAGVGAIVPMVVLKVKRSRRLKAFNAALPDAIDLMARCLAAGHSIGSSIEMIGQQSPPPLALEFVQVYQQQRLGLQFRDALLQMGARVPSKDLQFFITAILVQKETGGDLTEILSRTSHVIRDRMRIEGEVKTRTAQGRLTGWILGLLPVVMLVLINIISPGYSHVLFHDPVGQNLMYAGATLIAIGAFIIRRIVDIQV